MKLVTATKTKLYELTYLVPGSVTDSELTKVQEIVQKLVKKHKGTVKSEDVWGKKSLAYVIKRAGAKHNEASYVHLVLEFDTTKVSSFEKDVYLEDQVIRHLLVEAEADQPAEEQEPAEDKK